MSGLANTSDRERLILEPPDIPAAILFTGKMPTQVKCGKMFHQLPFSASLKSHWSNFSVPIIFWYAEATLLRWKAESGYFNWKLPCLHLVQYGCLAVFKKVNLLKFSDWMARQYGSSTTCQMTGNGNPTGRLPYIKGKYTIW